MTRNDNRYLCVLICFVGALTGCVGAPRVNPGDLFNDRVANAFDVATIEAVGDKVTDWQLEHLDDLSYIPNLRDRDRDRRGWQHGALYVGMFDWAVLPGNEYYKNALREIGEKNDWQLGERLFLADDHIVGQLYLSFYQMEQDPKMIEHTEAQFNQVLLANPKTSLEFFGDRLPDIGRICQLRWCWCDALFMGPQTWMQLTVATGDVRFMAYGDKEFWATYEYLFDTESNLFFRDSRYFDRRDEEGNRVFWSRGNGWVFAGIANILRILPEDHRSYPRYLDLYEKMAGTIAGLQQENGMWRMSLLARESYPSPETSGTAFFTYGLAWGLNSGILDSAKYEPVVSKGWLALVRAVGDDGRLGWVQPIGKDPANVLETDSQLYGVGAFLLAATQLRQLVSQ